MTVFAIQTYVSQLNKRFFYTVKASTEVKARLKFLNCPGIGDHEMIVTFNEVEEVLDDDITRVGSFIETA